MKGNVSFYPTRFFALTALWLLLCQTLFSQVTVSGRVTTTTQIPVAGFAVLATGTENQIAYTNNNGEYSFSLQEGGTYEIKPLDCDDQPLNGVTTYDVVLIFKHLLGTDPLTDPFDLIAADADNSGAVDLQDTTILRKLILGISNDVPAGTWKFVPKNYVFPDPQNPFSPPYPQSIGIASLSPAGVANADFYAIKIGDLNDSSIPSGCGSPNLPAHISGRIFQDQIPDCQYTTGEPPLAGWNVTAFNGNSTYYGTSNSLGIYQINLLPGTYTVSLSKPNDLWGGCVEIISNVVVTLAGNSAADFGLQALTLCPDLSVDLSALRLRRCFTNAYKVQYCNQGTDVAENTQVELELDPFFLFESSTVPATLVSGNTYSFQVGNVAPGTCNQFYVYFTLSCDAVLGQTHCTEAHITPDSACSSSGVWNGPDLTVEGECVGENVKFTITNHGADMINSTSYIVIEDIVVMTMPVQNPVALPSGASQIVWVPNAQGATVRLEVAQPAGHPWSNKASATVEGCGTNPNGTFSLGMVNLFPPNDEAPATDVDCMENTGSFDPNDKQGIPLGLLDEHFIPLQQPIDYMIRFQNTGTDTAFTVIIRDTLDKNLDPTTIRPLGSSHPYQFNLSGEGVAQFIFTNIMLPDSNINEAGSHGYVKFSIAPKANMQEGTVIKNTAAIFFDFNAPVYTNTTWHTLGSKYLGVSNGLFTNKIGLDVYPNPSSGALTVSLKSPESIKGNFLVYSLTGELAASQNFEHNQFVFNGVSLKSGYYLYKIVTSEGDTVAAGKFAKMD